MKIDGVITKSLLAGALSLACSSAFAGQVSIGSATAQAGGGPTNPASIPVSFAASGAGDTTVGFECRIYTPAGVTVTAVDNGSPVDTLAAHNAVDGYVLVNVVSPTNTLIADGVKASITYTVDAGAVDGDVFALEGVLNGSAGCEHYDATLAIISRDTVNGTITVIAEGPPTLTFDTTPVTTSAGAFGDNTSTGTIPATLVTSTGPLTTSYACVAPAGFTVAPASGTYTNASASATNLTVTTTLTDVAQGPADVVCTVTPDGGAPVDFTIPVSAPAGAMTGPTLTPTPASGSTITVNSINGNGSLLVVPSGGAGVLVSDVTCVATAPVTISGAFPVNFAPGASDQSFTVSVPLTDAAQNFPAAITCNGTSAGAAFAWTFDVAAPARQVAPPPPTFVPASSLWSKLALFGIFAALGMLVLGLRRNH